MPKWAKLLLVVAAVLGATGVVALFDTNWALGMLYGFGKSEIAMLHWMGVVRLAQFWAVVMAILFSSASIVFQFSSGREAGALIGKLLRRHCLIPLRKFFGIQTLAIVQKNGNGNGYVHSRKSARRLGYYFLPVFLLEPIGGVPSAVTFSTASGLDLKIACCWVLAANVVEKILWSYLVKWFLPFIQPILVPIMCTMLGLIIGFVFCKFLYTETEEGSVSPQNVMPPA